MAKCTGNNGAQYPDLIDKLISLAMERCEKQRNKLIGANLLQLLNTDTGLVSFLRAGKKIPALFPAGPIQLAVVNRVDGCHFNTPPVNNLQRARLCHVYFQLATKIKRIGGEHTREDVDLENLDLLRRLQGNRGFGKETV